MTPEARERQRIADALDKAAEFQLRDLGSKFQRWKGKIRRRAFRDAAQAIRELTDERRTD